MNKGKNKGLVWCWRLTYFYGLIFFVTVESLNVGNKMQLIIDRSLKLPLYSLQWAGNKPQKGKNVLNKG